MSVPAYFVFEFRDRHLVQPFAVASHGSRAVCLFWSKSAVSFLRIRSLFQHECDELGVVLGPHEELAALVGGIGAPIELAPLVRTVFAHGDELGGQLVARAGRAHVLRL